VMLREETAGPAAGAAERGGLRPRLKRNKAAYLAAIVLSSMCAAALFAGFLAPYGPGQTHIRGERDFRHHPPMAPRIVDEGGRLHWPPFVYGTARSADGRGYVSDKSVRYDLLLLPRGAEYRLFPGGPRSRVHLFGVAGDGVIFLFGTDALGRDVFSRILYGARTTLLVSLLGAAISLSLGLCLGAAAGYFGGVVDAALMRFSEVLMSLPGIYLIVVLGGLLPAEMPSHVRYALIVVILSFMGWAGMSRIVRGLVLSLKESEYVLAARALGAGPIRVVLRHIVPNVASSAIVAATISVPYYILGEASLSFLGVGIREPDASWGLMLSEAQSVSVLRQFTWLLIPGAFISLTVLCFNLLGDGLRDALDPLCRSTHGARRRRAGLGAAGLVERAEAPGATREHELPSAA